MIAKTEKKVEWQIGDFPDDFAIYEPYAFLLKSPRNEQSGTIDILNLPLSNILDYGTSISWTTSCLQGIFYWQMKGCCGRSIFFKDQTVKRKQENLTVAIHVHIALLKDYFFIAWIIIAIHWHHIGKASCTVYHSPPVLSFSLPLHQDVDECARVRSNQCESGCVNTLTSFYCTCEDGYKLNADQKTCRGEPSHPHPLPPSSASPLPPLYLAFIILCELNKFCISLRLQVFLFSLLSFNIWT